ncbi:MAG TPA: hypothetical protein PLB25_02030 [Rhodoferax sp.]|nr:hypothetical protein [Rhodoferax sp.]
MPRVCHIAQILLSKARAKVEKHLEDGYLRQVPAPLGVVPPIIAWMALS